MHAGFPRNETEDYVIEARPNIHKFFSAGNAYEASLWSPGIVSIWRKYTGIPDLGDPLRDKARQYLDEYSAEIDTAAANMGLTVEQLLGKISGIESANETIDSNNPDNIQRSVEYDVYFAEEAHARYGNLVGPVLLNAPIGNPLETEVHYLIPAAQASVQYGGWLGSVSYTHLTLPTTPYV